MTLPKVSIVVPIYNTAPYLRECLNSLVNQTYKNIEILCIDDGSSDNSYAIAEKYAEADSRIMLVEQENKGVSATRNVGLNLATGDYLMSCDSDDFFQLNAVELCVKASFAYEHCDAVFFNARMFTQHGASYTGIDGIAYENIPQRIICEESNFLGCFGNVCFGMFSLPLIRKHGLLFREGFIYEDWDFVVQFNSKAECIYWLNAKLYNYRWAQDCSIMGNVTSKCLDVFITVSLVEKHLKESRRWENNQYSFYIKALEHILYFKRERLVNAKEDVKKAFEEKSAEFIQGIPYTMLCSLMRFFPMVDRISILSIHKDHDVEVKFCSNSLRRQRISKIKVKARSMIKKILMFLSPTYRVASNSRFELEQTRSAIMEKINEMKEIQLDNQNRINLILRKLEIDEDERILDEIIYGKFDNPAK